MSTNLQEVVLETAKTLGQPTVTELIDNLVKSKGIKFSDANRAVYVEWKKGTLNLKQTNPPVNLASYFFNLDNAWFWAITALNILAAWVIFNVESSAFLYIRYALAGVFILFLPGFMLISTLFHRSEDMDGLEKLALSIGLSLAIVPLVGLILNYTIWGIRLEPMIIVIAGLTEVLAVACVVRKFKYHIMSLK